MQDVKRRTDNLEVDECLQDAHSFLVKYMDSTISAWLTAATKTDTMQMLLHLARRNKE